jgi:hypothetical protein
MEVEKPYSVTSHRVCNKSFWDIQYRKRTVMTGFDSQIDAQEVCEALNKESGGKQLAPEFCA